MLHYRVCLLNEQGAVVHSEDINCHDDHQAKKEAMGLLLEHAKCSGVELWHWDRLILRNPQKAKHPIQPGNL